MVSAAKQVIATLLVLGAAAAARADPADGDVEALLRQHSYRIVVDKGALAGPGAAFLSSAVAGAQFVALGEAHNNREIPVFATALFRLLHERERFRFLALEQDPVMMERLSRPPAKGNLEAIQALARQYPKGFVFISDQELRMLAEVGAIADSEADVLWGCEQAFGVTHILDELVERSPGAQARAYLAAIRAQSATAEAVRDLEKGHYIFDAQLAPVADELDRLFANVDDPRSAFLIEAIRKSDEIYGYYAAGDRGELPGYYSNNLAREEYMKTRCLDEYRTAQAPFNAQNDYGAFAAHERTAYLKPFAPLAAEGQWTLVDLRPFREYPRRRALVAAGALDGEAVEELAALVYGFDALLLLGGAQPATFWCPVPQVSSISEFAEFASTRRAAQAISGYWPAAQHGLRIRPAWLFPLRGTRHAATPAL